MTMLFKIREAIPLFPNPQDIVEGFSAQGVEPFLRGIFGQDLYKDLIYVGVEDDLYSGARIIQTLAYKKWEFFDNQERLLDDFHFAPLAANPMNVAEDNVIRDFVRVLEMPEGELRNTMRRWDVIGEVDV
jgi:hypothetical protein